MKKSICIIVLIIISFGSSLKTSAKEIEPVFYVKAESGETIYCADLSPDGKYIVAGFYKDIRLFDVSTGNIINKFAGYKEPIQNVFFSPDGKRILSFSKDKVIKLWDVVTGKEVTIPPVNTTDVYRLMFTPDGKKILLVSHKPLDQVHELTLWDIQVGKVIQSFKNEFASNSNRFTTVVFSPDGKTLFAGTTDDTYDNLVGYQDRYIKIWDVESGVVLKTLEGHKRGVIHFEILPDGKSIQSFSNQEIKVWDIESGTCTHSENFSNVGQVFTSPDNKYFISSFYTLVLWDNINKTVVEYEPNKKYFSLNSFFSFTKDSKFLFSYNKECIVLLPIVTDLYDLEVQLGNPDIITSMAVSPNGKYLVSGSNDGSIILWSMESGKKIRSFFNEYGGAYFLVIDNEGTITSAASDGTNSSIKKFSISGGDGWGELLHDGNTLPQVLTMSSSGYSPLVDLGNGQLKYYSNGIKSAPTCTLLGSRPAATSKGGSLVLFYSWEKKLTIVNHYGYIKKTFPGIFYGPNEITCVAFSPDDKYIVSGSKNCTFTLWDVEKEIKLHTFQGHSRSICSICFSPDGKTILSGASDNTLKLWDVATRNELHTFNVSNSKQNVTGIFTPDGKSILSSGFSSTIKLWDIESKLLKKTFNGSVGVVHSMALSSNGKYMAQTCSENFDQIYEENKEIPDGIILWDLENARKIVGYINDNIDCIDFSPDNRHIVFNSWKKVRLFDIKNVNDVHELYEHDNGVLKVVFSPDGKLIASCSTEGITKVWDISKGVELQSLKIASDEGLIFTPDSKNILSTSGLRVKLWNIATGEELKLLSGFGKYDLSSSAITPDGKKFITGSQDGTMKLWDIATGNVVLSFTGNVGHVNSIAISNDGKLALSGDYRTVRLWDMTTGRELKNFNGHTYNVVNVAFSNDNKFVFSSSLDGTVRCWSINSVAKSVTFVAHKNQKDWLIYTEDGYWDGSTNGGELVTMVKPKVTRSRSGSITNIELLNWSVDQFAVRNNRPDILIQRLGNDNSELASHFNKQYYKRLRKLGITEEMLSDKLEVPTSTITQTQVNGKFININAKCSDDKYSLVRYNIFVNDVPLYGASGKAIKGQSVDISEQVELTKGNNKVEISCMNDRGNESFRALTYATYNDDLKPDLYFLAFGVSQYQDKKLNLAFADKDATDLANVFESLKNKGFANVFSKVLTNDQVTPEAIKNAKDFVKNAKPDDYFVLFIAGHGLHDNDSENTYYYLTYNADLDNLKNTAADFETIEDLLQGIPPRNKLFLMDACESGEIDKEEQGQMLATATGAGISSRGFKSTSTQSVNQPISQPVLPAGRSAKRTYLFQKDRYIYNDLVRRSGAIVFSSSKGGELSYERSDIENGLFTESIIKALTTQVADIDTNGIVTTDELRDYVITDIAIASNDLQHPTVDRDNIYQKFGFQKDQEVKIKIDKPIKWSLTDGKSETKVIIDKPGQFTDPRDMQVYKTVRIGDQIWMAQNLNYGFLEGSWCHSNNLENCKKYGRLYNYQTAMAVCPTGWHLPNKDEFKQLISKAGGAKKAFINLSEGGSTGFNNILSGVRVSSDPQWGYNDLKLSKFTYFWSSTQDEDGLIKVLYMPDKDNKVSLQNVDDKPEKGNSVRCVKDK